MKKGASLLYEHLLPAAGWAIMQTARSRCASRLVNMDTRQLVSPASLAKARFLGRLDKLCVQGSTYTDLGNFKTAEMLYSEAFVGYQSVLGEHDAKILVSAILSIILFARRRMSLPVRRPTVNPRVSCIAQLVCFWSGRETEG